jgi:hypothetical protein
MLLTIKNKLIDIKEIDVLYNLYYNLGEIPKKEILKKNKIKNIDTFLKELKILISQIDNYIPLYDIFSKNIYLVKPSDLYEKINKEYNRPLTNELFNVLKNIETNDKIYQEKLDKNIKFMENFDLKILEETYIKTYYYQSNKIGKNFTLCIKPSFLPFINNNPYYDRDELINIGLNLKLIKDDNTIYNKDNLDKLCNRVSNEDIDANTLLNHYLFIQENNLKYFVKYYSFMGSYQMNHYIRNRSIKDPSTENNIKHFYNIISKAPSFDNNYYVYRLINKDDFLQDVKIGEIYEDKSFMSTSRNPFYNPKNNAFGLILMKIKLPKKQEGIGICIENYSLFPEEQEIILNPCKLKLISIDSITYYHVDKKAQKSIKKIYEFEYVSPLKLNLYEITQKYDNEINIPIIDLFNTKMNSSTIEEKFEKFNEMLPLINTSKKFYVEINDKKILLNVNKMSDKRIYEKFFFLQKRKYDSEDIIDELYITYQDEKTGELLLFIEIKDVISINYLQKFTGCNKEFKDNDLIELVSGISKLFDIYSVIIHPNFKPFSTIINIKPNDYKYVINNITDSHDVKKLGNDIILYNNDLINYLLTKKERFDSIHIKMNYRKYMLDKLNNIKISDVFIEENYEIYSVIKNEKLKSLLELIIFIFKNYFYMMDKVIYYINLYFDDKLIINKLYYIFDTGNYLFEKNKLNYTINVDDSIINNYLNKLDVYSVKEDYLR